MSKHDALELIHELDSYGLINQAASDDEIEEALTELAMTEDADGEGVWRRASSRA